jgi:hypothetical protein
MLKYHWFAVYLFSAFKELNNKDIYTYEKRGERLRILLFGFILNKIITQQRLAYTSEQGPSL